jgi:hypothetical protein
MSAGKKLNEITNRLELVKKGLAEQKDRQTLVDSVKAQNEALDKLLHSLDELKLKEFPEAKDEVAIKNLKDIVIPELKEISLKKPNWLKQFREYKVDLENYMNNYD